MSEQSELQRDLGRVEGKLDSLIEMIKENGTKHGALEGRVRKIEGRLLYFSGAVLVLGVVFAKLDVTKLIAVATAAGTH